MIGRKLRRIRRDRDITQTELGKRSGLVASHISHFESEERTPSLDNFVKVVKGLECTQEEIYNLIYN